MAEAFHLGMIAARSPMVAFRRDSIADDEDRAHRGIGAGLPQRLFCFGERRAHEFLVLFGRHRFEKCIILLDR
jgi:hypothetical protein